MLSGGGLAILSVYFNAVLMVFKSENILPFFYIVFIACKVALWHGLHIPCHCQPVTINDLLFSPEGDPGRDGDTREGLNPSLAVSGLWEDEPESSEQGAKVQGDRKQPPFHCQ